MVLWLSSIKSFRLITLYHPMNITSPTYLSDYIPSTLCPISKVKIYAPTCFYLGYGICWLALDKIILDKHLKTLCFRSGLFLSVLENVSLFYGYIEGLVLTLIYLWGAHYVPFPLILCSNDIDGLLVQIFFHVRIHF